VDSGPRRPRRTRIVMGMPPDEPGLHQTHPPRAATWTAKSSCPAARCSCPSPLSSRRATDTPPREMERLVRRPLSGPWNTLCSRSTCTKTCVRVRCALTAKGWISFGFHRDLDEAMFLPMEAMLDLMGELFGLDRHKALALASVAVDFRVTQVVNGARGVHALLPHGSIR
jgi:hypothetical protein